MTRQRIAAIDVGSNTVHLLVAEPHHGGLREVRHEVVMPRVGEAVAATGRVGQQKLGEVVAEVGRLSRLAHDDGAHVLLLGATEAIRRADDRDEVLAAIAAAAGVPARLIPGDVEAGLSFVGATSAHPGHGLTLVADVGGGSTECVLGRDGHIERLASVPIGSGAVTQRWLEGDPPARAEIAACAAGVREALAAAPEGSPRRGIATGGTATTLPALLGRPQGSAGGELTGADLDLCRGRLATDPSAEIARRYGIEQVRARVLPGGVEILDAVRERYGLDRIGVSHQGLRDGMILAWLQRGDAWAEA